MAPRGRSPIWFVLALAPALGGCLQTVADVTDKDHPNASDTIRSMDLQPHVGRAGVAADPAGPSPSPLTFFGSPADPAPRPAPAATDAKGGYTLNFENSPIATVAQAVLGDILNVGYVIDPRAQGMICLSSARPIAKKDVLFALENALKANNLVLLKDPVGYRIQPAGEGAVGAVDRPDDRGGVEPGYGVTVVPLDYVSATTLLKLMDGFASKPGMVRSDPSGRTLIVVGTGAERQAAVDTIRSFDVDWMSGQSVGIYPIRNSAPDALVAEIEKIMDTGENGLGKDLVKFQPMSGRNAVLVVAARPDLLRKAETWINRLDSGALGSAGVKVYRLRYGDAKQVADLLSKMFGSAGPASEAPGNSLAPGAGATTLSNIDRLTGGPKVDASASAPRAADPGAPATPFGALAAKFDASGPSSGSGVRILPDVPNNSLLIYASADMYRTIERAVAQLDRPKLQVAIEVTIAEVTLTDDLNYGVQFFIRNRYGSVGNSTANSNANGLAISPNLPGFNFVVGSGATPQVILSALHQYTDVKILSNPSLVVVDNQVATLEVGDQVPVSTGSANVLSANNAVVNTIDYKNTGIILRVQPRVNSDSSVLLDIEQEISSVPNTAANAAANLTPTISERKVKSELAVNSGQTVLLAGLVSETQNITHSGIPVLDQIPLVGNAFANKDKSIQRTELVLFIRPQIIRDGADASSVAEALRAKMRGEPLGSLGGLPGLGQPERKLQ